MKSLTATCTERVECNINKKEAGASFLLMEIIE
jgi:hypothetical protein